MKSTSFLRLVAALGAFALFLSLSSDVMAQSNQVNCARQLNACKRNCDAIKAQAKRTLDQCEAACDAAYRNCMANASTAAAKQACRETRAACKQNCRSTYAGSIAQANDCYRTCWDNYQACLQGGYDGQPE